jgi:SAM-dependent methyltransferase
MLMNPWLEIPLEDYEGHMSLPSIAQAQHLARTLDLLVQTYSPESVAIIGCSGGNGFEQLPPSVVQRVVGIDINPQYIAATRRRYKKRFSKLDLQCQNFLSSACSFEPVDLVFTGLVFEYVDYISGISCIHRFIKPGGHLSVILQLASKTIPAVSPSPYSSLSKLANVLTLVSPDDFELQAKSLGFAVITSKRSTLDSGKSFHEFLFQFIQ